MEQELVTKNLEILLDALENNAEMLINRENQDILQIVPKEDFESIENRRDRDRAKFVISKTVAYSPSAFEEDASMHEKFIAQSDNLINYLNQRQMTPIAELVHELVANEKKRDSSHMDYRYKHGS